MEHLLKIRGIKKYFPGTKALDWDQDDTVCFSRGEIWALAGENGAGKSTLIHILAGIYRADGGEIYLDNKLYDPINRQDSLRSGVAVVLQEPGLISSLTVAENLFLGRERRYTSFGLQNRHLRREMASELMGEVCPHINPNTLVYNLSLEDQKLVELARALSYQPSLLIIDETSAALSKKNVGILFDKMRQSRGSGALVIFISHHLEEVFEFSDRVAVLKDGRLVKTLRPSETDIDGLSKLMVGRDVGGMDFRKRTEKTEIGQELLQIEKLAVPHSFEDISFTLHQAEIIGIGGLAGAGQEDILPALFGDRPSVSGQIRIRGRKVSINNPREAIAAGLAYASRNRDKEGLILRHSIRQNISLPSISRQSKYGFINQKKEQVLSNKLIQDFRIKCRSGENLCIALSGGNRQKVVLARWIASGAQILLLDNPTRGIDVGAKAEIYSLMNQLVQKGVGIVMVSDDLPELIAMSDRIIILRQKRVSAVINGQDQPSEHDLINYMI